MYYIIFDFEWNNAYNYKTRKGMNEIIEIGAVKLDEKLNIIDTFKQLIKPSVSKKLTGRFKDLTHITIEEIKQKGADFDTAFKDFARWSQKEESVFMSWSDSDLYVLVDNFKRFRGTTRIDFIKYYADVQKYCMSYLPKEERINQISLIGFAQRFDIDVNVDGLHRALEDCYLTCRCFEKVYEPDSFKKFIRECGDDYFDRLIYKPYFLTTPSGSGFNIKNEEFSCPVCNGEISANPNYEFANNTFRNFGICNNCSRKYWLYLRAKKMYDSVAVSKRIVPMNKKKARKIDSQKNKIQN